MLVGTALDKISIERVYPEYVRMEYTEYVR